MARELVRFEDYSRSEVHDIFSPTTDFIPQRGTRGILGIVAIPGQPGDYVFFVTFGQKQGQHEFEESITEHGVLTWQSQPKQMLDDLQIVELIHHDETKNLIHLFLRTQRSRPYTYLGTLKYLRHDPDREQPVYFQWQILDWKPKLEALARIGLNLIRDVSEPAQRAAVAGDGSRLLFEPKPTSRDESASTSQKRAFARKQPDYSRLDAENRELGLAGELLVLEYEIDHLRRIGRSDLAQLVRHVAVKDGDAAGYDIKSFFDDGRLKFIECKTTKGDAGTSFFASSNEIAFSESHSENYVLYRLYNFDDTISSAMCFTMTGALSAGFTLTPTQFRVSLSKGKNLESLAGS